MLPAHLPRPLRLALYGGAVCVLLWLCLSPSSSLPSVDASDKIEHLIAWFVLCATGLILAPRRPRAIAGFALGLGIAVEIAQATMGLGRNGDWKDFIADSLGVAIALGLYLLVRRFVQVR